MSDESPRKRSALWAMLLTVAVAWSACAVYRWRVPPVVEARAVVQVPSATDLGTLCRRPDVLQGAVRKLKADGAKFLLEHPVENLQLSGTVTAQKFSNVVQQPATSSAGAADSTVTSQQTPRNALETWELSYRTRQSDRVLDELSAVVAVLERHVSRSASDGESNQPQPVDQSPTQIPQLEARQRQIEQDLQELPIVDPTALAAGVERTQALELEHTDAFLEQSRDADDWDVVEQEFQAHGQLATAAELIGPGPVQQAVQQLERQRQLSRELTQLNATERRMEGIYGDRHPKLIELRNKFDQLLTQLGGWDEVIDEQHLGERLKSLREAALAEKQELVADLALRLELEESEFAEARLVTQQRSELTTELETVQHDLMAARQSHQTATAGLTPALTLTQPPQMADLPWYLNAGVLFGLTTVCSLFAGRMIHRAWLVSEESDDPDLEHPVPSFASTPLDLAERRALRKARLQHAYAG